MSMHRLFRQEAVEARRNRWLGPVSIAHGPRTWVLAAFACVAAASIAMLLALGDYTRRTRVIGQVVPSSGLVTVSAPTHGILGSIAVAEGDTVSAGATLLRIDVPSGTGNQRSTERAVDAAIVDRASAVGQSYAAQRAQLRHRSDSLEAQHGALRVEIAALQSELVERNAQLELADQSEQRLRRLRDRQFVTESQWQQQRSQVLEQRATLQRMRREAAQLQRELAVVVQERASIPDQLDALAAAEARERSSLGQERLESARRGEAVLSAPVDGTVTALLGQPGQSVQAAQPVLTLLPRGASLEAHLLLPSRAIGFVQPGDAVLLRYQAFPYQKFGQGRGQVVRVSRSALSSGELAALALGNDAPEPLYRIVVSLERESVRAFGRDEPLKPGMLLEADVMGERRALWEWLLEPLFSVQGRTTS